jgi:hypothetical protein
MGDIHVGDELIAADGSATVVSGVYPQGVQPIYRVTLSDGSTTRTTLDHLWPTKEHDPSDGAVEPWYYPRALAEIQRGMLLGRQYELPGLDEFAPELNDPQAQVDLRRLAKRFGMAVGIPGR